MYNQYKIEPIYYSKSSRYKQIMEQENIIVSVEGNIGSGKSTLVSMMKQSLTKIENRNVIYLEEPVHIWENICDEENKSILEKFYQNQEKYGFSFQMMAYISRLVILKNALKKDRRSIIITERSIHTDKNVFASMLYEEKKIEPVNYKIYLMWFNEFISDIPPFHYIYLQTPPNICFERIMKRSRTGEIIPLDYLEKLTTKHDTWLRSLHTLILDGSTERTSFDDYTDLVDEIKKFINNIIHQRIILTFHEVMENTCC